MLICWQGVVFEVSEGSNESDKGENDWPETETETRNHDLVNIYIVCVGLGEPLFLCVGIEQTANDEYGD